jgi:hypothetical protein
MEPSRHPPGLTLEVSLLTIPQLIIPQLTMPRSPNPRLRYNLTVARLRPALTLKDE